MKALTDTRLDCLEWRAGDPPDAAFELTSADGLHATLVWKGPELPATAETPEGTWTFLRLGTLGRHVTVREADAHHNMAEFHPHALGRGKLEFRDGAVFAWAHLHHGEGYAFLDAGGNEMLRLQPWPELHGHVPGRGMVLARVVLEGQGLSRWRHAFLAAFGWYLLQLEHHDARVEEGAAELAHLI